MRLKSAFLAILIMFGVALSIPQNAVSADVLWADVTIDDIYYSENGAITFRLSEISKVFEYKQFKMSGEHSKGMLAVVLTAQSLDKTLRIAFYDGTPAATIILAGVVN